MDAETLDHLVQITWTIGGSVLAALVVIVGVAVKIALGLNRRDHRLADVEKECKANASATAAHNDECREDRERRHEWEQKTDDRLGEGATKMARLDERYQHLHEDVRAIRGAVLKE